MPLRTFIKRALAPLARRLAGPVRQLPPALWGMTRSTEGALCLHGQDLGRLAAEYGTPLHLHDAAALRANVKAMQGLDVFYSYKTQPLPAMLSALHAQGVGAEVISEMELDLALRLGMPGSRIIYNGPAKSEASLRTAIAASLLLINVNHREELLCIGALARESGQRPRIGIRVTSAAGWSAQFGTPMAGEAAVALFEEALAMPELEVVGLHVHRGALLHDEPSLVAFLDEVLAFADRLRQRLNWTPSILDLGGSLAIPTVRSVSPLLMRLSRGFGMEIGGPDAESGLTLTSYTEIVRRRVGDHFAALDCELPRIVVELGRALSGNTQCLIARVMSTREGADGNALAILDGGINIASILRVERHQCFLVCRAASEPLMRHRLVGPICQPGDVLVDAIHLPQLRAGDVIAIMDSGAYFEPDSTSFSFPRPGTLAIDGRQLRWLRVPETLDDVTARDRFETGDDLARRALRKVKG